MREAEETERPQGMCLEQLELPAHQFLIPQFLPQVSQSHCVRRVRELQAHIASVPVFVQQMAITLAEYLLIGHLRIVGPGVKYGSGKYRIKIYHFVRLRDYPAIDGTRPGFIGRAVILDGLPHHVYLLRRKPPAQSRIGLQHTAGNQMVRLSALTYSDIMVSRYRIHHIGIKLIPAASVHLSGR